MLLGHQTNGVVTDLIAEAVPDLNSNLVARVLARHAYSTDDENQAERAGMLICAEHIGRRAAVERAEPDRSLVDSRRLLGEVTPVGDPITIKSAWEARELSISRVRLDESVLDQILRGASVVHWEIQALLDQGLVLEMTPAGPTWFTTQVTCATLPRRSVAGIRTGESVDIC